MATLKLIIDPKKWLGDNKVLKMDWDVRAMHFHLMLIAWQNNPQGCLECDTNLLAKYLSQSPKDSDWINRILPQLLPSWEKKEITHDGKESVFFVQSGLLKEIEKQKKIAPKKTTTKNAVSAESKQKANPDYANIELEGEGFNLMSLIDDDDEAKEKQREEEQKATQILKQQESNIWTLGVQMLTTEDFSAQKARNLLGRLAKEHGSSNLAQAIASLGMKKTTHIDTKSYLIASLKNITNPNSNFKNAPKVVHNQASGKLIL